MHHLLKIYFPSVLITLFLVVFGNTTSTAQSVQERVDQMKSHRSSLDFDAYLKAAIELDSTVIEHPYFNLCILEAALLTENDSIACAQLERRVEYNADLRSLPDTMYKLSTSLPCFQEMNNRAQGLMIKKITSEVAFVLSDSTIHPESIVFDSTSGIYYISSVRHRAIYAYKNGEIEEFIPRADQGIGAVLGLAIDSEKRLLYATSAHIPEMEGYDTRNAFRNTLLKYHLDFGILLERNDVFDATRPRLLSEIKVASDGTAFISDSYEPVVMRWNTDNSLEEFIRIPEARSLQGLAFDESSGVLYVADYSTGLYSFDLYTGQRLKYWSTLNQFSLVGIDGLYFYHQKLIGIQNGTVPQRIIEIELSDTAAVGLDVLENNIAFDGEPTNGVILDGYLNYISNSPWPFYQENKPEFSRFQKGVVRKLKL